MNRALDAAGALYLLLFVAFMLGPRVPAHSFKVSIAHAQAEKGVITMALTIASSALVC